MHQPSPSPIRGGRSSILLRKGSQPTSLDTLPDALNVSDDTAGFIVKDTAALTTAARAIDRAALQAARAARMHAEERVLEAAESKPSAEAITIMTPPHSAGFMKSAPVFNAPVVSRAQLHRLKAARLHSEERQLESAATEAVEPVEYSESKVMISGENVIAWKDRRVFLFDIPSQSKLQGLRAKRLHDAERELEVAAEALADRNINTASAKIKTGRKAYVPPSLNRIELHRRKAERLHAEERVLELAAAAS